MERQKIVAGNWKMNLNYTEGRELSRGIVESLQPSDVLVILCPPFIHLQNVCNIIKDISNVRLGAQNCHQETSGAYTGEVSAPMLRSVGVSYVILGHSERREYFGESDDLLAQKIDTVLAQGMRPIFCCGEPLAIREKGEQQSYVEKQIEAALFHLTEDQIQEVTIAYEPIWAIGTGKTASPGQAQEMHAAIRQQLAGKYGKDIAGGTSILYGGSVKPNNAAEIFQQADVDGGLIGGASLKEKDFISIVEQF